MIKTIDDNFVLGVATLQNEKINAVWLRAEHKNEAENPRMNWIFDVASETNKRTDMPDLSVCLEFGEKNPRLISAGKSVQTSQVQKASALIVTTNDNEGYSNEPKFVWRLNGDF